MTTTFETAKVGDKVWCIMSGWGEVRGTDAPTDYPIAVYFTSGEFKTYTVDGRYTKDDLNQTLFWGGVVIDAPTKTRSTAALPADEKQISALQAVLGIADVPRWVRWVVVTRIGQVVMCELEPVPHRSSGLWEFAGAYELVNKVVPPLDFKNCIWEVKG